MKKNLKKGRRLGEGVGMKNRTEGRKAERKHDRAGH